MGVWGCEYRCKAHTRLAMIMKRNSMKLKCKFYESESLLEYRKSDDTITGFALQKVNGVYAQNLVNIIHSQRI